MSNKKTYHDQGQKDASEGRYDGGGLIFGRTAEEDRAYRDGYFHTKGQIAGAADDLSRPHGLFEGGEGVVADNEIFDKGWAEGKKNR